MEAGPGHQHSSMRKGTHSCVECRRRKVRCLFSPDDQTSCITCRKKGKICQEQRREHFPPAGGKKTSLKDRVAKLEALLKSSDIEIDDDSPERDSHPPRSGKQSNHEPTPEYTSRSSAPPSREGDHSATYQTDGFRSQSNDEPSDDEYDPDPLVALFNNGVWQSQGPKGSLKAMDTYQLSIDQRSAAKRMNVLGQLRQTLISPHLLRDIINASSGWWQGWRPLGPWPREYTTAASYSTLQDYLLFAYNTESPAIVGLAVLCIAESIRKLTRPIHDDLIRQLPRPPQELFQILFERVDRLINSDSDFSNTKEGIDCLCMSGKLFQGLGLPKRTWLSFHRAIVYGQFHGLHSNLPRPGESREERNARYSAWEMICQTDLFISMTLGLPYTCNVRGLSLNHFGSPGEPLWFQKQVMDSAAQLIDRNQSGMMMSEESTRSITTILDIAASSMSPEFWAAPGAMKEGTGNRLRNVEWTTKQMFYCLTRMFTHLPLSIRSIEQPHLEGHRLACQAGCRGVLTIYNTLRGDSKADVANLIDYQAFIASSILLLALLGYGNSPGTYAQQDHHADRELISMTLALLHRTSSTGHNSVAAEAVEGLDGLFMLTDPNYRQSAAANLEECKTRIKIPYVGTISIVPGEYIQRAHSTSPEPIQPMPVFTFSHIEMANSPPQAYQIPGMMPAGCVTLPPSQIPLHLQQDMMDSEFTSIDFEFDNLMAMNPGDWSWITAEVQPDHYY